MLGIYKVWHLFTIDRLLLSSLSVYFNASSKLKYALLLSNHGNKHMILWLPPGPQEWAGAPATLSVIRWFSLISILRGRCVPSILPEPWCACTWSSLYMHRKHVMVLCPARTSHHLLWRPFPAPAATGTGVWGHLGAPRKVLPRPQVGSSAEHWLCSPLLILQAVIWVLCRLWDKALQVIVVWSHQIPNGLYLILA